MTATIVLLVKNGAQYLSEVLDGIHRQTTDIPVRVLAVDSGSVDGSLDILAEHGVETIEIPSETFNHGGTRNLGAKLAGVDTDYVVYLTQDASPADASWLDTLVAPLRADPDVAGAFSRHIARPGSSPALVRQLTERWQSGQPTRLVKEMPEDQGEYQRNKLHYTYFSDTSSAIRRSVWEEIPFPRTDFAEDAAWADQVLLAGHRIVFEPASTVIHSHDYSLVEQFRQNVDHAAGMQKLFPAASRLDGWGWVRAFLAIPREVVADWRFMHLSPPFRGSPVLSMAVWAVHSPLWHAVSILGAWVGTHSSHLPARWWSLISRQERLRGGSL